MGRWLLLVFVALAACGDSAPGPRQGSPTDASARPSVRASAAPAPAAAFGEWHVIDGSLLGVDPSSVPYRGTLRVRILAAEMLASIPSRTWGEHRPQGRYLAVYYEVENGLSEPVGAAVIVGSRMRAVDGQGRTWPGNPAPGVEADAAERKGFRQGEGSIGPGFTGRTAAVFDVPPDARDLRLVIPQWNISVPLGLP